MSNWDKRFVELAQHVATWSKDRSRQVGCVIVGSDREVRSTGYNGFPRGVNDGVEARHARPAKYLWTEHCERNAIYNAARCGIPLQGCTIYLAWFPCMDCSRAIIQSGITTMVSYAPDFTDPKWGTDFRMVCEMFTEAGVTVRYVEGVMQDATTEAGEVLMAVSNLPEAFVTRRDATQNEATDPEILPILEVVRDAH